MAQQFLIDQFEPVAVALTALYLSPREEGAAIPVVAIESVLCDPPCNRGSAIV